MKSISVPNVGFDRSLDLQRVWCSVSIPQPARLAHALAKGITELDDLDAYDSLVQRLTQAYEPAGDLGAKNCLLYD
jgi:hypothetical protein